MENSLFIQQSFCLNAEFYSIPKSHPLLYWQHSSCNLFNISETSSLYLYTPNNQQKFLCPRSSHLHSPTRPMIFSSWWNLEAFSTGNTWLSSRRSDALGDPSVAGLTKLKGFCLRDAKSGTGWKQDGGSCPFSTTVTSWCSTRTQTYCTASLICKISNLL